MVSRPAPRVAGAVLAAGAGARMGGPKSGLVVDGVRLLDRAVSALRAGGCHPVIAVVRRDIAPGGLDGALAVVNDAPERGLRSSLELAVAAADDLATDALAVLLVDLPGVGADAVRATLAGWRPGRIARARFGMEPGHPIVMAVGLWREALAVAAPDSGAREYLARQPDLVDHVAVPGDPADLDLPADLVRWQRAAQRTPRRWTY